MDDPGTEIAELEACRTAALSSIMPGLLAGLYRGGPAVAKLSMRSVREETVTNGFGNWSQP